MVWWNATSPFFTTNIRCNWHGPHRRNLFCLERKLTRSCPKESYFWRSGCFNMFQHFQTINFSWENYIIILDFWLQLQLFLVAVPLLLFEQPGIGFVTFVCCQVAPGKTEFGRLARTSPGACLWKRIKSDCWIVVLVVFLHGASSSRDECFFNKVSDLSPEVDRILVSIFLMFDEATFGIEYALDSSTTGFWLHLILKSIFQGYLVVGFPYITLTYNLI